MRIICTILLCSITFHQFATEVIWSSSTIDNVSLNRKNIVGFNDNYFYFVKSKDARNDFLLKMDLNSMNEENRGVINRNIGKKWHSIYSYEMFGDQPALLSYYEDEKKTKNFIHIFDQEALTFDQTGFLGEFYLNRKVVEPAGAFQPYVNLLGQSAKSLFKMSGNTAIYLNPKKSSASGTKILNTRILDENLSIEEGQIITLPFYDTQLEVLKSQLTNDGKLIMLANQVTSVEKKVRMVPDLMRKVMATWLISYDIRTKRMKKVRVSPSLKLKNATFKINRDGEVVVLGLTASDSRWVDGTVTLIYDNNLIYKTKSTEYFGERLAWQYLSQKVKDELNKLKEKQKTEDLDYEIRRYNNFLIRDCIEKDNGRLLLLIEHCHSRYNHQTNVNGSTEQYYSRFTYDGLMAVNYRETGEFLWIEKLNTKPKTSVNYIKETFISAKHGNDVYIVFNTNEGNSQRIIIDDNGKQDQDVVFEHNDEHSSIMFINSFVKDHEIFLCVKAKTSTTKQSVGGKINCRYGVLEME